MRQTLILCLLEMSLLLGLSAAHAQTYPQKIYYVGPSGADSNPGTAQQPFATPQRALDLAGPGDTIILRAGYAARLDFPRSGTPDRPITLQGEPGAVLDAGERFRGWQPAPEIGAGVYKHTALPYQPYTMLWNDRYILRIRDDVMANEGAAILRDGPLGFYTFDGPLSRSWNGVQVMWGTLNDITYIGFGDGRDPNEEDLRVSPYVWQGGAPIIVDGQSYLVIRGLTLRNGNVGIYLANGAHHITIEQNTITGQHDSIGLYNGAHHNIIRGNTLTLDYVHTLDPNDPLHWFVWYVFKVQSDYDRTAVLLYQAGAANQIAANTIIEHWDGVADYTDTGNLTDAQGTDIFNNTFRKLSDSCYEPGGGQINVQFHDNTLRNCNEGIRVKGATPGPLYIYRNTIHNAGTGPGEHTGIYLEHTDNANIYIYHNTISTPVSVQYRLSVAASTPSVWLVNNVLSGADLALINAGGAPPYFDYNWVGGDFTQATWMGRNNIFARGQRLWTADDPELLFPSNGPLGEQGIDLSRANQAGDVALPSLPGMPTGYFRGARPDLGAYQYTPAVAPTGTPTGAPPQHTQYVPFVSALLLPLISLLIVALSGVGLVYVVDLEEQTV